MRPSAALTRPEDAGGAQHAAPQDDTREALLAERRRRVLLSDTPYGDEHGCDFFAARGWADRAKLEGIVA